MESTDAGIKVESEQEDGGGSGLAPREHVKEEARCADLEVVRIKQEPADSGDEAAVEVRVKQERLGEDDGAPDYVVTDTTCVKVEVGQDEPPASQSGTASSGESGKAHGASAQGETLNKERGGGEGARGARSGELLSCDLCSTKPKSLSKLKEHMRIHTGEKPYSCDTCLKSFTRMNRLNKHVRIHSGEKPYCCDVCKREFTLYETLKIHQRIHTGEKPYSCDSCDKRFADRGSLKRHSRVHTNEKPYACLICQKAFAHLGTLKIHERSHSGDKPYTCGICDKKFKDSSTLKRHERIHTGDKPYTCDVCSRAFTELGRMHTHRQTHFKATYFKSRRAKKIEIMSSTNAPNIDEGDIKSDNFTPDTEEEEKVIGITMDTEEMKVSTVACDKRKKLN